MDIVEFLLAWSERYVRHRDVMQRQILEIKRQNNLLIIQKKDSVAVFVACHKLSAEAIENTKVSDLISSGASISLVCLNTGENLKALEQLFPKLAQIKTLQAIMLHPLAQVDEKWIIVPYIHSKICDTDSLAAGLKSMFDTVGEVSQEDFNRIGSMTEF